MHDTFVHSVNVQSGWFSWFDGSLPVEEAYALPATAEDPGSLEVLLTRGSDRDKYKLVGM